MTDDIDFAVENVKKGLNFSMKNYRKFFPEMFKVTALAAGLVMAIVLLLGLLFFLGLEASSMEQTIGSILILVAVALIVMIIMAFVSEAVQSVVYNIMDKWGKKTPIIANFKRNFKPIVFYILALIAINIVAFIPIIILMFLLIGGMAAAQSEGAFVIGQLMVNVVSRLYQLVVGTILAFILQFAIFELIITRMGVVNSIKKSYATVKKTLVPTVVFDILAWVVEFIVSIAVIFALIIVLVILVALGAGIYFVLGSSSTILWILIALGIPIFIILAIAVAAVELTATLPMKYFYWKKAREIK